MFSIKEGWQFVIRQADGRLDIEIRMARVANFPLEDDKPIEIAVVTKLGLTVEGRGRGDMIPVAAVVTPKEISSLMDALWESGFRPKSWGNSTNIQEIKDTVTQAHDAVMKIAEKLEVEL